MCLWCLFCFFFCFVIIYLVLGKNVCEWFFRIVIVSIVLVGFSLFFVGELMKVMIIFVICLYVFKFCVLIGLNIIEMLWVFMRFVVSWYLLNLLNWLDRFFSLRKMGLIWLRFFSGCILLFMVIFCIVVFSWMFIVVFIRKKNNYLYGFNC